MTYTTASEVFNNYPSEFKELSMSQEPRAKAEFDRVTAIEQEIKNKSKITNQ